MNLTSKTLKETNRYELTFEVPAEDFQKAIDEVYRAQRGKITIPGFRRGKAPKAFIEKYYGESVFFEDAVDRLFRPAVAEAIEASELQVISVGQADVTEVGKDVGVKFKVEVVTKPEITVSKYKGIKVKRHEHPVTDEDVEKELARVQDRNSRMVTVEDRNAENGDTVDIDYEGFCDGVAFEGGKGENYSLALGSNTFIPGFEDQIVGHATGDEFDVNVTFPEDYHSEDLKGKAAVFMVKVHEIKMKELPVLDDEFAKDVSEFDTLDEYKNSIKERLTRDRGQAADAEVENQIVEELVGKVEGEIPEEMYDNEAEENVNSFAYRLQAQGLNLETYLKYTGMDVNALKEQFKPQAEQQVKLRLALEKIAADEKLEPTDEEVQAEFKKLADTYQMEEDRVRELVGDAQIKADLKSQKALDFVKSKAKVTEEPAEKE